MIPHCSDTPAICNNITNKTYQNFYDLLGKSPINIFIPTIQYLPETNSLQYIPIQSTLGAAILSNFKLKYLRPIKQTVYLDTF